MNILRLTTAGSVDDGKSTFIGRLLFDTNSLPKDKVENIQRASEKRGLKELDLSLITDGLTAEREQGITIDVAHIYFATKTRKYIIADTPGHIEYTRNMVTGASNSQVFLILIDARNGVVEQTKRHLFIAALMGIKEIVFIINKMDLVEFKEGVYQSILNDIDAFNEQFGLPTRNISFFPISAKYGDNVAFVSENTPWYNGKSVLDYLESLTPQKDKEKGLRFNVQYVIRPQSNEFHDFRGYAGKVTTGTIKVGDKIKVAGSGQVTRVVRVNKYKNQLLQAQKNDAVVLELEDDIDISRGDLLVHQDELLKGERSFGAKICWLNVQPLNKSQKYVLQIGAFHTPIKIEEIVAQLQFDTLCFEDRSEEVKVNSISEIHIKTASPVFIDSYTQNPDNGSFILIDPNSNATVAVGFKI